MTVARRAGIGCLALLMAFSGIPAAQAAPGDGPSQASCVYTLSKPFVVQVSGATMVTATLKPLPCTGNAAPNSQDVCVELQGSGNAPQCKHASGYTTAQVYFTPYRPGSTYTSTGTGCGPVAPSLVSVCRTQGPLSATL